MLYYYVKKKLKRHTGSKKCKNFRLKTHRTTGSAILLGASSKLLYKMNKDVHSFVIFGFISGLGKITKLEIDYVFDSNVDSQRTIFTTNGLHQYFFWGKIWVGIIK